MLPDQCARTGRDAYGDFSNGLGRCHYGSRHDTLLFVTLTDDFAAGPICDDEIDAALERGEIECYGSYMDGLLKPSRITPKAALRLFEFGVLDQVSRIGRSAGEPIKVKFATSGTMTVELGAPVGRPSWHGLASFFSMIDMPAGLRSDDFLTQGALWALMRLAANADLSKQAKDAAAREALEYALAMERAGNEADEAAADFIETLRDGDARSGEART